MATKMHTFKGKAHWAKLKTPDEAFGDVRWAITLEMEEKAVGQFKDSGLRLKLKDIGTGQGVQFRRPVKKLIKDDMVEFEPPKVTTADGAEWDGLIGNGSDVEVTVAVYDSAMGKGHRLDSVKILNLVEYNPEGLEEATPTETKPTSEKKPEEESKAEPEKAPW